ncbi:MAG: HDOD domain-containing protein [Candidatus Acidiferrum sp.]
MEGRVMGFTHAESGRILAELWRLPAEVSQVIEFHHRPQEQKTNNECTILVQVADQLCWKSGLGYGYSLAEHATLSPEDIWQFLSQRFAKAQYSRYEDYAPVLESNLAAARELADHVFGKTPLPA